MSTPQFLRQPCMVTIWYLHAGVTALSPSRSVGDGYNKTNKKSKIDLAIEIINEVRDLWRITPEYVVFDSFYAAPKIVSLLHSYGMTFISKVKSNRIVNGAPIKQDLTQDGDQALEWLAQNVQVRIVKHDNRFFCTNDLSLSMEDILFLYGYRWSIEEMFRFLKSALPLEKCQARSISAQKTHLASCLLAFLFIQKEHLSKPYKTLYSIREHWQFDRRLGYNKLLFYFNSVTA
ncbi:MAG: hypothetical protein KatS3mg087_1598 [Patescibacteria group bacterium]|nr:MAG: hypothetical protein KatS3mg087_1598 [Patescibacteria group bacterium]